MLAFSALAVPAGASADTTSSSNWAGYAVHRPGLVFRKVSATWRQPRASCTPGNRTYAAFWVGLGGYALSSPGLEQAGTEVDCGQGGQTLYYAWYEMIPSRSMNLPASVLTVRPGDVISASVTVAGHKVTISLRNDTRHQRFRKILQHESIDVSSAEWIVEAPWGCNVKSTGCVPLPLADFRSATFHLAEAAAASNPLGSISDPFWQWTRINLRPGGGRFVANRPNVFGSAATSALHSAGRSFRVTYSRISLAGIHRSTARVTRALNAPRIGRM